MATGNTTTASLADSLPTVISSARQVREQKGVMPQLVDRYTLGKGIGLSWHEVSMAALTAQSIGETTVLDNPQQMSDTLLSVTPTVVGIETLITDRVAARLAPVAYKELGGLAQSAMQRKKDTDGLAVLDTATTSLSGAGTTLVSGIVDAAVVRILGNATEPGEMPIHCVLHPYQIKDIADEMRAGIGTYVVPDGATADIWRNGMLQGVVSGAGVFPDGNITIDSDADAKGGVFSKRAIILVEGTAPRAVTVRREDIGGGASVMYMYDEYAYGQRSSGSWLYEIYSDSTAPTS